MTAFHRIVILCIGCGSLPAQERPQAHTPVRLTVTVEPYGGRESPAVLREDVLVFQNQDRMPVTEWTACQGENAGLELFILMDDGSDTNIASQFGDVSDFISAQPASTAIGIGYMRNGMVDTVQPLTSDHAKAVTKLRLPMSGSTSTNPYASLSELIRAWPAGNARREVLMVTPGIGGLDFGGESFHNIFVDRAIADAQRAGVLVHAIYALGAGHKGHSLWQNLWAQHYLAQVAEETGGEAYSLGFGATVSLAPYLSEFALRLTRQYWITFAAGLHDQSGFQTAQIETEAPGAEILSARRFYVEEHER